jgi:hypothetical protein
MRNAVRIFRAFGASSRATTASSRSNQANGRWIPNGCSINPATRFSSTIAFDLYRRGRPQPRQKESRTYHASVKKSLRGAGSCKSRAALGSRDGPMLLIGSGCGEGRRNLARRASSDQSQNFSREVTASHATLGCNYLTSRSLPVSTSKMTPRTGTSLEIHGCDLTFLICSRVFCSGSL